MKPRALQVKVVRTDESDSSTNDNDASIDTKVNVISDAATHVAREVTKYVAVAVCGFVALDTLRQVLIARASTPFK